jgi:hypothetical protein
MAWDYGSDPIGRLTPALFKKYANAGVTVWGASAFRGASGRTANVPDMATRIADLTAWAGAAKRLGLAGIVATGWGRYGHVAVPCEGLDASLHMLVLAGASMWDGKLSPDAEAEAMRFLTTGRRKALAGERFVKCLDASRAIAEWRARFTAVINWTSVLAEFAGEPDRVDEKASSKRRRSWTRYISHGEKVAKEWVKAHAELVPRVWLERYVESRFWQGREISLLMGRIIDKRTKGRMR